MHGTVLQAMMAERWDVVEMDSSNDYRRQMAGNHTLYITEAMV